jgi:hypothetical protein
MSDDDQVQVEEESKSFLEDQDKSYEISIGSIKECPNGRK